MVYVWYSFLVFLCLSFVLYVPSWQGSPVSSVLQRCSFTERGVCGLQPLRGVPALAHLAPVGWNSLRGHSFRECLRLCCLYSAVSSTSPSVSSVRHLQPSSPCASPSPCCLQGFHKRAGAGALPAHLPDCSSATLCSVTHSKGVWAWLWLACGRLWPRPAQLPTAEHFSV